MQCNPVSIHLDVEYSQTNQWDWLWDICVSGRYTLRVYGTPVRIIVYTLYTQYALHRVQQKPMSFHQVWYTCTKCILLGLQWVTIGGHGHHS